MRPHTQSLLLDDGGIGIQVSILRAALRGVKGYPHAAFPNRKERLAHWSEKVIQFAKENVCRCIINKWTGAGVRVIGWIRERASVLTLCVSLSSRAVDIRSPEVVGAGLVT